MESDSPPGVNQEAKARQLERSLADLRALSQVIVEISRSLDLNAVLRASSEGIQRVVHGDAACFLLMQPGAPTLQLTYADALPAPLREQLQSLTLDPEIVADAASVENRNSVIAKLGQRVGQILRQQSIDSYALLPLTAQARAVGVLLVLKSAGKVLEPKSIDLLMSIGEQVGLAIENARLHASVKAAEEWRREFMEYSPDGFWEVDLRGRIIYVNDAACRLLGYDRETLMQMRVADLVIDDVGIQNAAVAELTEKGVLIGRDARVVTKSGETRIVNYTSRVVRDQYGNAVRIQSVSQDVTERRQLSDTLRRQNEELNALNRIAEILSHPLELERSLHQVCEQIVSITGMEGVAIAMLDESRQFLYPVAHYGVSEHLMRQAQRLGMDDPLTRSIVEGDGLAVNDMRFFNEPGFDGPRAEGYRAGIGMPIRKKGVPAGVIFVGSKVQKEYAPSDIDLLRTISNQIAVALENSELYVQMQRRVDELDGLAQLSAACTTSLDPVRLSEIAVAWTQKLLPSELCSVRLIESGAMRILAGSVDSHTPLKEQIELDEVFRRLVEDKTVLMISDVENDASILPVHREGFRRIGIRSFLAAPMPVPDRVIGVLAVGRAAPHVWQPREIELLQTIANQMANAIHNAVLFQNILSEQRKVQAIFDSGVSGLYATDAQGRIVMFNRAAERMTGWRLGEVQGKLWREIFDDTKPLIDKALEDKESVYAREGRELKTRDGRVIPVSEAAAPLYDEKGQVTGAVGAFWDLSREKAAELSRERFLLLVAHQLRTPLSALLGALQLLERPGISQKKRAELWQIVRNEGTRLKAFSDRFLDLETEIKSPRPLQLEALPLTPLVRQIVRQFAAEKPSHQFQVRACKPEPIVHADAWRVENVLHNLLDNAATYSPEGSLVMVSINLLNDGMVDVAVRDQGEGIPFEERERIFEPFYRASRSADLRTYGHGLGLSIVKGMVEEMGGRVWVGSEKAPGATFHFTLRRDQ
jgi:PAS domain S-box-containing protein